MALNVFVMARCETISFSLSERFAQKGSLGSNWLIGSFIQIYPAAIYKKGIRSS